MSVLRNAASVVVLSLATVMVLAALSPAADIYPTCDTYVDSRTGLGYPSEGTLTIGDTSPSNGVPDRARAYFKFDLTEAVPSGAYPVYAVLNVDCQGFYNPPMEVGVYYLEDDDWDCHINWATAPAPSSTATGTVMVGSTGWYEWNVTTDVVDAWDDDQGYSVVLRHVNEGDPPKNSDWNSMEDYYEEYPYLQVGFEWGLDFGDAPDPTYPTLLASNGAAHSLETGPRLGIYCDYEPDGQPDPDALGDDNNGPFVMDDEDGVVLPPVLVPGETATVRVLSTGHGYLSAWVDFDISGDWSGLGEAIFISEEVWAGDNMLSFDVPADAASGRTFARFRIRNVNFPILSYDGFCESGEVEDYAVLVGQTDWGDAPDPTYPTSEASGGAMHIIANGLHFGDFVDHEPDGQPDPLALGDDAAGDDEDGIRFTSWLMPGRTATVEVASSAGGYLDAWIDFLDDGSWAEPEDHIFSSEPLVAGSNILTFYVPSGAPANAGTFARFRISSQGGLSYYGFAEDGEVEDYFVDIKPVSVKWVQPADVSDTTLDINTTYPFALVDNFVCTERGYLVQIEVWGAWREINDGSDEDTFTLAIHEEDPTYGGPGDALWVQSFAPGEYIANPRGNPMVAGWLDPGGAYSSRVCQVRQLIFYVDPLDAFMQMGSEQTPVTYWLSVQSDGACGDDFGWRNSVEPLPWDGSYYGFGAVPVPGGWIPLSYPAGHQYDGEPPNLAFTITSAWETGAGEDEMLREFRLHQNTPNPFNPVTDIRYDVPAGGGRVLLEVFDVSGRLVRTLVDGHRDEGTHHTAWEGKDESGGKVSSGIYFYRLTTDGFTQMLKMVVLK